MTKLKVESKNWTMTPVTQETNDLITAISEVTGVKKYFLVKAWASDGFYALPPKTQQQVQKKLKDLIK